MLRECQEIPGQRLFQYLDDDGAPAAVHSHDVNDYLREAADAEVTAKDFRTWVATVSAAAALGPLDPPAEERDQQAVVKEVVGAVSQDLGNTPTVCRTSYIHPKVLSAFGSGELPRRLVHHTATSRPPECRRAPHPRSPDPAHACRRDRRRRVDRGTARELTRSGRVLTSTVGSQQPPKGLDASDPTTIKRLRRMSPRSIPCDSLLSS